MTHCLTRDPRTPPFVIRFLLGGERAEGKAWSRSRLGRAGDEARELLPWTAGPGAQKNFDPEHPLARDSNSSLPLRERLGEREGERERERAISD
jgi:hypothetical protein